MESSPVDMSTVYTSEPAQGAQVYPNQGPASQLSVEERKELRAELLGHNASRALKFQSQAILHFGPAAGVFARQLLFWDGRGQDKAGWIYKVEDEWRSETGLSRHEQRKARKRLVGAGVLEEEKRGVPRRLWYRLNLPKLMEVLGPDLVSSVEKVQDSGREEIAEAKSNTSQQTLDSHSSQASKGTLQERQVKAPCKKGELRSPSYARVEFPREQESTSEEVLQKISPYRGSEALSQHKKKEKSENRVNRWDHSDTEYREVVELLSNARSDATNVARRYQEGKLPLQSLTEAVSWQLARDYTLANLVYESRVLQALQEESVIQALHNLDKVGRSPEPPNSEAKEQGAEKLETETELPEVNADYFVSMVAKLVEHQEATYTRDRRNRHGAEFKEELSKGTERSMLEKAAQRIALRWPAPVHVAGAVEDVRDGKPYSEEMEREQRKKGIPTGGRRRPPAIGAVTFEELADPDTYREDARF